MNSTKVTIFLPFDHSKIFSIDNKTVLSFQKSSETPSLLGNLIYTTIQATPANLEFRFFDFLAIKHRTLCLEHLIFFVTYSLLTLNESSFFSIVHGHLQIL